MAVCAVSAVPRARPYPDIAVPDVTTTTASRCKRCQVCSEKASGNFFGALVCLPCKTFFIRCSSEEVTTFRCRVDFNCEVSGSKRSKCKYCRYRKCIDVGMARKERPEHVEAVDGQQLCVVCRDVANGVHFGIVSCEGCKKFFRRGLQESDSYICKQSATCVINPKTRNDCRFCRFQKCLRAGMSRDAIKMGRPRKQMRDLHDPDGLPALGSLPFHHPFFSALGHRPLAVYDGDRSLAYGLAPYYSWCGRQLAAAGGFKAYPSELAFAYTAAYLPPALSPLAYCRPSWVAPATRHASFASTSGSESDSSDPSHDDGEGRAGGGVSPFSLPAALGLDRHAAAPGRPLPSPPHAATPPGPGGAVNNHLPPDAKRDALEDHVTFTADYWLEAPRHVGGAWCDEHARLAENVVTSYLSFVDDFCCDESETGAGAGEGAEEGTREGAGRPSSHLPQLQEEELKTGIIDKMSQVITFIKSLPGFVAVHSRDQYVILRLGWVQVMGLVAAINLYDPNTHTFRRDVCAQRRLATGSPLSRFSDALLVYARAIYRMKLNTVEAALITSLVVMATDWPGLREPQVLENSREKLLATMQAYIAAKYGSSSGRLEEMLRHVPQLRQLGLWHYRITFQLWVNAD